jgi:hypothetical protein
MSPKGKLSHADGITTKQLLSWAEFENAIRDEMLDYRHFIWRGQASSSWLLEPTLDRLLKKLGKLSDDNIRENHLRRFKYASRGKRGKNPHNLNTENEWWALGQHNGLSTPLLDWTTSPFVAAYFAFYPETNENAPERAVFGLSKISMELKSSEITAAWKGDKRPPILEFVEPLSDENDRLVNQGGLFTRSPDGVDIEQWAGSNFKGDTSYSRLIKYSIPNSERALALRSLNRMNINHLSLFPDLYGGSKFCNLDLLIDKY